MGSLQIRRSTHAGVVGLCAFGLLAVHATLTGFSAASYSSTHNEPAHLVAGLSHLEFYQFDLFRVNPPLVRCVAAGPVWLTGYVGDWTGFHDRVAGRPVFAMGVDFIAANARHSIVKLTLARWACMPFCLLGGWVCFLWARDLLGRTAGLFSCALWCFSTMVLGLGSTIAPDAHAAALGLAACYTFWHWLKEPTWLQTILTGVVLGLAELSKTTFILFYPIWPVIWVVYRLGEQKGRSEEKGVRSEEKESVGEREWGRGGERGRPMTGRQWGREGGMLAVRMLIGIYVLNLGYLGEGSFTKLGEFQFVSELFGGEDVQPGVGGNRFADTPLASVPVPFPKNYILGIDIQQRDFEDFGRPSYLRGEWREKGWWYYYIYAVLVKTPLGTLGLMLLSVVVCFTRFAPPIHWYDAMVLLVPPAVIFAVASYKCGFSHHSRYIMPCVPFVFVWLGQFGRWMEVAWSRCSEERGVGSEEQGVGSEETESVGVGENGSGGAFCNLQFSIFNLQWFRGFSRWLPSPRFGERGRGRREPARGMAGGLATSTTRTPPTRGGVALGVVSALLLCWTIGSSLYVYPHSLSYFNELAGGPKNGPAHLLNSNIDWGQDLLFLEKWAIENAQGVPVYTAFYNLYNPFDLEIAGIEPWPFRREDEVWDAADTASVTIATDSDAGSIGHVGARRSGDRSTYVADGFYAISVNLLYDYPWAVYDLEGRRYQIDRRPHGYLRSIEPVGWAGYSIRIFSAQQLRAAFAAQPTPPLWDG